MKCVRYNTVHYDKPLLPLCVCFHNVKLDFTAKTARFARSRAASAQRPVRVGHTQATSYIRTHTTSHWKWCLLVCMTALVCIRRRRIWHHKPLSDNVSDAMCWVWLIGSVQQYQLVWDPTAIHKREREREREGERHKAVIRTAATLFVYMTASPARPWHLSVTRTAVTVIKI